MRVGLALPQYDGFSVAQEPELSWATVVRWAQRADELRFDSVWLSDHLHWSIDRYGAAEGEHAALDPLVALAALARRTADVRLGTLVLNIGLRPPAVLAKQLAAVDRVSGGRLLVGVGAGYHAPEHASARVPFPSLSVRRERLAEAIGILDDLLRVDRGDVANDHDGMHFRLAGARNDPSPLQAPRPPIVVGGKGDRLVDLVARTPSVDGWQTGWALTPAQYRARLDVLRERCEHHGRDPASVELYLGAHALVGEDDADLRRRWERFAATAPPGVVDRSGFDGWRVGKLAGTVAEVAEQVGEWSDLGVSTIVVNTGAVPFSVTDLDDLELLRSTFPEESE